MKANQYLSKTYILNTALNYVFFSLNILVTFFLLEAVFSLLGKAKFGIWSTLIPIIAFSSIINFGIGSTIRNVAVDLNDQTQIGNLDKIVTSGLVSTGILSIFTWLLLIVLSLFIGGELNYNSFFGTDEQNLGLTIFIFVSTVILTAPFNVFFSVSNGRHKTFIQSFHNFSFSLVLWIFVVVLTRTDMRSLFHLSVCFSISKIITTLIFSTWVLVKFKIKILNIPLRINYKLLNASKLFLAAQFLSFLYISIDPYLITDIYGSIATAEYSISSKLSFTIINVFSILLIQFWSSIRGAANEKNFTWMKKTIRHLMNLTGLVLFFGLVISIFEKQIMQIWLGDPDVITSKWTLIIFSFYAFLHCLNAIYVNIQNGIGELKTQVISLFFVIILYVIACYNFHIKSIGYSSIILFKTISMLLLIIFNSTVIRKLYGTNRS
tara:strand:+ start:93 stop:1400 length:1308 start_codon:yes stop_codon:yes gene_type:complete